MTAQGQLLVRKHQQAQIRNGGLAALLAATIGEDYLAGKLSREEFVTGIVGQGRLSHDAAARMAEAFVREYRGLEAPELVHPEPLHYVHDNGAALGRAVGVLRDLDELRANPWAPPDALAKVVQTLAVRQHQAALDAGRDVIVASAASTGRRWRRVTDGNPCAFCAMLATRTDYTSPLAAQYVVGRGKSTKIGARGRVGLGVKPRGKRQLGQRYHDRCGCTVAEVFDDWEPSYAERQQHVLYNQARDACDEDGVPASPANIMRKMRELGQGVLHDAHVPDDGKRGREAKTEAVGHGDQPAKLRGHRPRTQAGGAGGKPPKIEAVGDDSGSFEDWKRHSLDGANDEELDALRRWTTNEHKVIQEQLRSGQLDEKTALTVQLIDAALSRNPLPRDVELHRRDTLRAFQATTFEEVIAQVGRILDLPAYVALSTRHGGVKTSPDAVVRVHVTVPRGTPAAYIEQVSEKPKQRETLVIHGKLMAISRAEIVDGVLHVWCSMA